MLPAPEHLAAAQLREVGHTHWQLLADEAAGGRELVVAVLLVVGVPVAAV